MFDLKTSFVGHQENWAKLHQAVQQRRLGSTHLFSGMEGIGKRQVAVAVAQQLLCSGRQEACGECSDCIRVKAGKHESVLFLQPDGAQIKVEQSRSVIKFLSLKSNHSVRIVIIDDAHLMNSQAANSLLKILEEPPSGVYFFLLTSNDASILPTIKSRCQKWRFQPLTPDQVGQVVIAPNWVLRSCQGRVSLAQQLSQDENSQIREQSFLFLRRIFDLENSLNLCDEFKAQFSSKEASAFCLNLWQQLLRDIRLFGSGLDDGVIHQDLLGRVPHWKEFPASLVDFIWQQISELQQDLIGNVEKSLSMQYYIQTWQPLIRQAK